MAPQLKVYKRHWLIPRPRRKPNMRWHDIFFHILMFFQRPHTWSNQKMALNLMVWAALVAGTWNFSTPRMMLMAGLGLLTFAGLDWLLLAWLPRARHAFGPINPQLMFMLIPRLIIAITAVGLTYVVDPVWCMMAFFGMQAITGIAYVWSLAIEPHRLAMTELSVTSPHLPADAAPIRMLHLSDFHVERLTRREQKVLDLIEEAQPDLIVITGDYLNASNRCDSESISQVRDLLGEIHAPCGVYAVLGTPAIDLPYIAPLHFEETDIQLLRRDIVEVDFGDGRKLALMGLDCTHDVDYDTRLLNRMTATAPKDTPRVFLYHSPELMPTARNLDIDLYLCGHTHGGQVRVPGYGALFTSAATGKRYEMGRYDENDTTLYVSRGIGMEGFSVPRMRLFCPPEITMVTIRGR